jgi:hypothetical protein
MNTKTYLDAALRGWVREGKMFFRSKWLCQEKIGSGSSAKQRDGTVSKRNG